MKSKGAWPRFRVTCLYVSALRGRVWSNKKFDMQLTVGGLRNHVWSQVKSAPTPAGEPNVRAEAEKRKIYTTKNAKPCTTYKHLSQNVEEATTWSRNPGNTAKESPIGPHFSQQFPHWPKPCTCKTFPISRPKFVAGVHAEDLLDVVSMQVSSSPSVRQVNLECKKQKNSYWVMQFVDQEEIPLAWDQWLWLWLCACMPVGSPFRAQGVKPTLCIEKSKCKIRENSVATDRCPELSTSNFQGVATGQNFSRHGTSDPRTYSTHAKYHAIVPTNLCPVEAPQCNEQVFETEHHTSPNVLCIMVGALQGGKLLEKQLLRNTAVDVW